MGYVGPTRSASFRTDVNKIMTRFEFWDGDDGWLLNIVHKNIYGYDALMTLLWDTLQTRLRAAQ
jgi:hypothetical protein